MDSVQFQRHRWRMLVSRLTFIVFLFAIVAEASAAPTGKSHKQTKSAKLSPAVATAVHYAEAIAKGDHSAFAKMDFACLYRQAAADPSATKGVPAAGDPAVESCWKDLAAAHAPILSREDVGMDVIWPSNGDLVFYREALDHYPASAFVMEALGLTPPGTGLHLDPAGTTTIPAVSFRLRPNSRTIAVPATLVKVTVTYQDPLMSPISYAPGSYQFTSTTRRPQRSLKAVTVQWVVVSGLKRYGFPSDSAVVNLPVRALREGEDFQEAVPFATERSRMVAGSAVWWTAADVPGLLVAAAARAAAFPELRDRVALLNRVLLIDPNQPEALTVLSKHLYDAILKQAGTAQNLHIKDPALAIDTRGGDDSVDSSGLEPDTIKLETTD